MRVSRIKSLEPEHCYIGLVPGPQGIKTKYIPHRIFSQLRKFGLGLFKDTIATQIITALSA
jgi:hypothetical protein